jgi:hypothetical protein
MRFIPVAASCRAFHLKSNFARPSRLDDEVCFRLRAQFSRIQESPSLYCPDLLIRIIMTLLSVLREALLINQRKYKNWAKVHFISDLMVGVFEIIRAPDLNKQREYIG